MKSGNHFTLFFIVFATLFATTSCKRNKPSEEAAPTKTATVIPPPPPPTTLEAQLYGDWICDGDTVWSSTPRLDSTYYGYHLNLTDIQYPSNSNFVTYLEEGLYSASATPNTNGTWKEIVGAPTYTHHVLIIFFPATVIMSVTTHNLVLAQTDHPGNVRTYYFHK